ncbi:right-handed parallel beta-helix repeat-containing protein [Paenibacillus flagellatus]|nr:right-handed parallel beta-helix repeat-containing protein [Paenibacillus flagellatus]
MANEWTVPGDFATINGAIASPLVQPYDTIRVAPGFYTNASEGGPIVVTKTIQLLGAQAGVDARTRSAGPAAESIIEITDVTGSVQLNAANVVFDGFTVRNNATGFGIFTSPAFSGYWIFNNVIQNNEGGLSIDTVTGAGNTFSQVRRNALIANNQPGGAGGNGIYTQNGSVNVLIDSNRFTGHTPAASINFAAGSFGSPLLPQANIVISNNDMIDDNSIALTNTTNVKIRDNRMRNTQGSAIFLGGGNTLTEIEGNVLHDGISNAIYVNTIFLATPNTNIRAIANSIQGNANAGLLIDPNAYDDTLPNRRLEATNNWWGSATGPANPANPGGTGDAVIDNNAPAVSEFIPFLDADPIGPTVEEQLAAALAALAASQAQNAALQASLAAAQAELAALQAELASTQARLAAAESVLASARAELTAAQGALDLARTDLAGTLSALGASQAELAAVRAALAASDAALAAAQAALAEAGAAAAAARSEPYAAQAALADSEAKPAACPGRPAVRRVRLVKRRVRRLRRRRRHARRIRLKRKRLVRCKARKARRVRR